MAKYENERQERCKHKEGVYFSDGPKCRGCHMPLLWVPAIELVEIEQALREASSSESDVACLFP